MAAGLTIDITQINSSAGDISRAITHHINRAMAFKRFLDRFTSAQLVSTYGFVQADADLIKSAFTDLGTLNTTFQANRAFIDQLVGVGDV
jgi:hypothetical protein